MPNGDRVYHAKQDCWQQAGGYNEVYNDVFKTFTHMEDAQFKFTYNDQDGNDQNIKIWAWKGDYLNLGAGAETGIYKELGDTEHYVVDKDLSLEMGLTLTDNNEKEVFTYKPGEDQWWITGFNPYWQGEEALPENLIATTTINFTGNEGMYDAFEYKYNGRGGLTFDEDKHTVTIVY